MKGPITYIDQIKENNFHRRTKGIKFKRNGIPNQIVLTLVPIEANYNYKKNIVQIKRKAKHCKSLMNGIKHNEAKHDKSLTNGIKHNDTDHLN